MTYRYFELGKNADPEREDSAQFKNAFTVHPISEPNLMYRLHKRFSQIELEWTYLQIQQLQVCNARHRCDTDVCSDCITVLWR